MENYIKTTLVVQSFGRANEYKRALLTILSYYAYTSLPMQDTKVILFTDKPEYFTDYFQDLPVIFVPLTLEKIKIMRGEIDFLHRMKISLIDEAFSMSEGNLLYADSDTFFIADPTPLVKLVNNKKSYMHLWEYKFESMRELPLPMGKTFHAFLSLIQSKTFELVDGSKLKISPQQASWNAGVMIFHSSHVRFIPDVYKLTDQFYPTTLNHASEQYAFSILMQNNTEVQACDDVIYHYWYRVKKQIIDLYLNEVMNQRWTQLPLKDKLENVKFWTLKLPRLFEQHILTIKDNAVQAFNEDRFSLGYQYAFKAMVKTPFDNTFLKDIVYHTKRKLLKSKNDKG